MPTVWELSAPYENYLVPVVPVAPGICAVCHTSVAAAGTLCYQCSRAGSSLGATASAVGYTALAVKGEQLARDLWVYKNGPSENIRWAPRLGLAAVLWRSLALHEGCLAAAAKVPGFSVVTTVPSTSGRADEPIAALAQMIGATHERYQRLLWSNPQVSNTRDPRGDRYSALRSLVGRLNNGRSLTSLTRSFLALTDSPWLVTESSLVVAAYSAALAQTNCFHRYRRGDVLP